MQYPHKVSLIAILFSSIAFSQTYKTSSTVLSGKEFPKIDAERKAEFQVYFPDAKSVILDGGDGMKSIESSASKGENGFWNISTSPMEIGFHYYWFNVDGQRTNDPNTQLYFGYSQPTSGIEVPSGEDFFLEKNVKHGKIVNDSLRSEITHGTRNFKVYLPPNYGSEKLPVLYLYHGTGEDITGWEKQGYILHILDNLFAENKAKKMIVVMDYGVALNPEQEKLPDNYPRTVLSSKNLDKIVIQELIPYIEKKYKTSGKKAIAGLSRGSYQAMLIGVSHPEVFSAIGAFSPVIYEGTEAEPFKELPIGNLLKTKKKPYFFIGIGEKEDVLFFKFNEVLTTFLHQNNYPYFQYKSPETRHEWLTWRRSLYQFSQHIFKR
ncbi:enterochelin esterase family protein [Chryseobacterium rhizosphaerae]|uniref:Enterochelin esterase family protein n=1 Tax=Chryseobacterium rhizosphaerae TaxID=395937 RepID=A0AAE4C361_9FLAO|nr:alpha/beta hydrolase-fold protein [Chryseobacterium rhizosphaerae]MDR6525335.1 enterochelin esterase family protein [Chryseobacterium rhizosphaerae]